MSDRETSRLKSTRINNLMREGRVEEVKPDGSAVVDAHGVKTKPLEIITQAGAINKWSPPSVGQRVVVLSPGGDLGRAVILPGGHTDDNPAPHDQLAQERTKIGSCTITQTGDGLTIVAGGVTFTFSSAGFAQQGGVQTHDGRNVGRDHRHKDVTPGTGTSGEPIT